MVVLRGPAVAVFLATVVSAPTVVNAQVSIVTTSTDANDIEELIIQSDGSKIEKPPEAVTEVDVEQFELEAADLGQILNRQQGITVRRTGGLGSNIRFTLNGLSGNQVRFFVDGVPLELSGLGSGIADVPPSLIGRVAIYRGVVPARLGADALGGAIELRTRGTVLDPELRVSYLVGSFGTHRVSASAALPLNDDGLFVRAFGFFDRTDNDFLSEQRVADFDTGAVEQRRVRRFHDGYEAFGASLVGGWSDHPDFGTLTLRAFVVGGEKEVQQGLSSFTGDAFGEAERSSFTIGGIARFDVPIRESVRVFGAGGVARIQNEFFDVSTCTYSWLGECGPLESTPGEAGPPTDSTQNTLTLYLRSSVDVELVPGHTLRLSAAPTYTTVGGEERFQRSEVGGRQSSSAEADRRLVTAVIGLEYELQAFGDRLDGLVFGKWYGLDVESESFDVLEEDVVELSRSDFGVGTVVQVRLVGSLAIEASYEYALRIPTPVEFFGVPGQIEPNLRLEPEQGHNANVGLRLRPWATWLGTFKSELNAFMRDTDQLIQLATVFEFLQYQNVRAARSIGVESSVGWTSPGRYVSVDGSITYMDFRNTSTSGEDAAFNGDRIPNTPYFFGSTTLRFLFSEIFMDQDQIELAWTSRFVEEFFLSTESIGRPDTKDRVEFQVENSVNVGYRFKVFDQDVAVAFDVQNLTDESLFDFFGIQRPGRGFFFRVATEVVP